MLTNRYVSVFTLGITLVLMWSSARFSQAVTINVPADQGTIQAGIDAAVNPGDEVVVAPGTYVEAINFLGKAITLRSSGGAAVTTIDGGAAGTVVTCTTSETSTTVLDGFTITNGSGGMYNSGASCPCQINRVA